MSSQQIAEAIGMNKLSLDAGAPRPRRFLKPEDAQFNIGHEGAVAVEMEDMIGPVVILGLGEHLL